VPIIEDLAQGLGGEGKRPIRGDLAVLSFHPTKCLTTGEGGMLVVRDPKALGRLEEVTDVSRAGARIAVFSPLSDMAASLGQSQVARYDRGLRRRSEIASSYAGALEGSEANFDWYGRRECMFFRFPLRFAGGLGAVQEKFASAGVTVRRGVDELLHRLLGRPDSDFPRATQHYHETVSLPIYPALEDAELESCIAAARGALFSRRVTA
jgi:UDP-4-amino-4-deoxy-L-arabinose-oxoglutarate aminotransferase